MPRLAIEPSEIRLPDYGARVRINDASMKRREELNQIANLVDENKHLKVMNAGYIEEIGVVLEENRKLEQRVKAYAEAHLRAIGVVANLQKSKSHAQSLFRKLPGMLDLFEDVCKKNGVKPEYVVRGNQNSPRFARVRWRVVYELCIALPDCSLKSISEGVFHKDASTVSRMVRLYLRENPDLPPVSQMSAAS